MDASFFLFSRSWGSPTVTSVMMNWWLFQRITSRSISTWQIACFHPFYCHTRTYITSSTKFKMSVPSYLNQASMHNNPFMACIDLLFCANLNYFQHLMPDPRPIPSRQAVAQQLVGSPLPVIKCDDCPWHVMRRVSTTPEHRGWVFSKCQKAGFSASFYLVVYRIHRNL